MKTERKRKKFNEWLVSELVSNPTRKSAIKTVLHLYKSMLDIIFDEATAEGRGMMPDEAMGECEARICRLQGKEQSEELVNDPRYKRLMTPENASATRREAHHYAVDLFYETYGLIKLGAPTLPKEESQYILELRKKGMSHAKIAIKIGLPFETPEEQMRSKDVVRKRIKAAKKKLDSK